MQAFTTGREADDLLDVVQFFIVHHPGRRQVVAYFVLCLGDQGIFYEPGAGTRERKPPKMIISKKLRIIFVRREKSETSFILVNFLDCIKGIITHLPARSQSERKGDPIGIRVFCMQLNDS